MNSFSFTLSGKHFICPSILNDSYAGQSNLGFRSLIFITLNISCQPLLDYKVSFEKSAESLMGTPLQVTVCFYDSVFTFKLWYFNYDVSWCGPPGSNLFGTLCFLDLYVYFLCQIKEVFFHFFSIIFSNNFSISCSSSLPLFLLAPL